MQTGKIRQVMNNMMSELSLKGVLPDKEEMWQLLQYMTCDQDPSHKHWQISVSTPQDTLNLSLIVN
jgi:hypothetical protein